MRNFLLLLCILINLASCDNSTAIKEGAVEVSILPQPKELTKATKQVILSADSKLYASDPELQPLLELFSSEIELVTGLKIECTTIKNHDADIVFNLDTTLPKEVYSIEINETVQVYGGSYTALANAKSTLLQILQKGEQCIVFPVVSIKDSPDANYRGIMIDLARQWHDVTTIKEVIDLAAFYKINYLQLHFTDDQSFTLPSEHYPKLSTSKRHYQRDELEELERYSQVRGVTIIPEIDVPGHTSQFTKNYPELFAIQDVDTNSRIINIGKEEVYTALAIIIEETLQIFESTPYFHIGGDEARFDGLLEDPSVQNYMTKHTIGTDVHDLFNHFICRMNRIIKSKGKQMCVWEGFGPDGNIEIPKDIIVFPFETNRYLPNKLIDNGYTVVNTSWKPLYVVNNKKWEPKTIYDWNIWRWENWWDKAPSFTPIQLEHSEFVIGAQMCAWEQPQKDEIPSLRKRLPVLAERTWNTEKKISYNLFISRMERLDKRLSLVINNATQDSLLFHHNFKKEQSN